MRPYFLLYFTILDKRVSHGRYCNRWDWWTKGDKGEVCRFVREKCKCRARFRGLSMIYRDPRQSIIRRNFTMGLANDIPLTVMSLKSRRMLAAPVEKKWNSLLVEPLAACLSWVGLDGKIVRINGIISGVVMREGRVSFFFSFIFRCDTETPMALPSRQTSGSSNFLKQRRQGNS